MIIIKKVVTLDDINCVVALADSIWRAHYTPIIGVVQVEYMLAKFQSAAAVTAQISEGYEYYLAEFDQQRVGYMAIRPLPDESSLFLSKIYVDPSLSGKGVGCAMMKFCENICRSQGLDHIWLTVNKHNASSIQWYAKRGFQRVGSIVQDIGGGFVMDDFKMAKQIVAELSDKERENPGEGCAGDTDN